MVRLVQALAAVGLWTLIVSLACGDDVRKPGVKPGMDITPQAMVRPPVAPPAAMVRPRPAVQAPKVDSSVGGRRFAPIRTAPRTVDASNPQPRADTRAVAAAAKPAIDTSPGDGRKYQPIRPSSDFTPRPKPKPAPPLPPQPAVTKPATRPVLPKPQPNWNDPRWQQYPDGYWANRSPGYYDPYRNQYGYPYEYAYDPYTGSAYAYSPYYGYYPHSYYAYPPPIFAPAGLLYGPGPIMQLMGVAHWWAPPVAGGNDAPRARAARADPAPARRLNRDDQPNDKAAERGTNAASMTRAQKFIGFGDAHFANQKFADALSRYKTAAQTAPQLADAWFRQGIAQAALGHYEQAVKAIKRGLELKPNWAASDFHVNELYGGNGLAQKAHLEAMTKAAEEQPNNGDLQFVLGLYYHFDGKPEQAAPCFQRAAQLGGNDDAVKGFLDK